MRGRAILSGTTTRITCAILGPLEVLVDGQRVDLASRRERALLGALLLRIGDVASVDELIDSVWGDPAPASARHMVHEYVSRLRDSLGEASVIATRAPGYTIERGACELDAARFAELLRAARSAAAADELDESLRLFDEALGFWRGDVLSHVELDGDARSAAARLDDERRAAGSERFDVALALGRHTEVVPELERAAAAEPQDEHLLRQLMTALYRSGRQADALARYRDVRQRLVQELGIEPGAELRSLEQAILQHDPDLAAPPPRRNRSVDSLEPPRRRRLGRSAALVAVAGIAAAALALSLGNGSRGVAPVDGNAVAVIDAAHARLLGSVPVDSRPAAVAAGAGSIWVSSPDASSVTRISPATRRVVASIPLDRPAASLAAGDGSIWAVGSDAADTSLTLDRIDPTFDTAARVRRLPMVSAGDTGSVASARDTVVVAPRSGFLTRIDARSGRVARIDPNAAPAAVAQGFGSSWLAYPEADAVVRVDATGALTTIPVGREPTAVTVGRRAVWVADTLDDTVKSIDPATSSVITTIAVGHAPSGIAEGGGDIWVANAGDGTVTRIDEATSEPTARVLVGGSPQALVVAGGNVWVTVQPAPPAKPTGGTLVVSVPSFITQFDPAIEDTIDAGPIESEICSTLVTYPDEAGAAGLRLVPDAARTAPTISDGGRTYTFRIRPGLRFSPPSNEPVDAETFKHAIERSLSPRMEIPHGTQTTGQQELPDVVGGAAYIAGKTRHIAGITADGDRLTIRLVHPASDLPARLATQAFCAVPADMPLHPVNAPFPTPGPYYIASETPGKSLVLLRNPNYHGDRPRRPRRIEVVIGPQHPVEDVEASRLDYAIDGVRPGQSAELERRYGAGSPAARRGHQQYFVNPELEVDQITLNTSRPLFASARMRRAVSYAVDRQALAANGGAFYAHASVAEMALPPGVPGFRDEHIYPFTPDVAEARRLAGPGHRRAVLYCFLQPGTGGARAAQIVARNLAAIGIAVRVDCMPGSEFYARILTKPNDPWDMAIEGWEGLPDPADYVNALATDGIANDSHLHDQRLDALLNRAERTSGLARAFAYAHVDHVLVHDVVPWITYANESQHNFFSARVGCQVYQPLGSVVLGALCIRTGSHE